MAKALVTIGLPVIGGIMLADILTHAQGTKAAGSAAQGVLKPTYNALLGVPS